jgi:hypothetical protein
MNKTLEAVTGAFNFTSKKISENLVEHLRREKLELNETQVKQLLHVVESSVGQCLSLTYSSIEKTLK